MEPNDPMARVRERRRRALVDELLPMVRRLNPTMPDDQVLEMADSMAELRLLDEEMDQAKPLVSSAGGGCRNEPSGRWVNPSLLG